MSEVSGGREDERTKWEEREREGEKVRLDYLRCYSLDSLGHSQEHSSRPVSPYRPPACFPRGATSSPSPASDQLALVVSTRTVALRRSIQHTRYAPHSPSEARARSPSSSQTSPRLIHLPSPPRTTLSTDND